MFERSEINEGYENPWISKQQCCPRQLGKSYNNVFQSKYLKFMNYMDVLFKTQDLIYSKRFIDCHLLLIMQKK